MGWRSAVHTTGGGAAPDSCMVVGFPGALPLPGLNGGAGAVAPGPLLSCWVCINSFMRRLPIIHLGARRKIFFKVCCSAASIPCRRIHSSGSIKAVISASKSSRICADDSVSISTHSAGSPLNLGGRVGRLKRSICSGRIATRRNSTSPSRSCRAK